MSNTTDSTHCASFCTTPALIEILVSASLLCFVCRFCARAAPPQAALPPSPETYRGQHAENCAICLEDVVIGQPVRPLPCEHTFHALCLDTWVLQKAVCPLCNHAIT